MYKKLCMVILGLALSGCVRTLEMPLAPNAVRIDTQASGLLFVNQAVPATMRAAANATLERGYTHFKIMQAELGQGEVYAGSIGGSSGTVNTTGTYGRGFVQANSSYSGYSSSTAINKPVSNSSATVLMFNRKDPQSKGAFDAAEVLKQYKDK